MDLENLSIKELLELRKEQSYNGNLVGLAFISRKIFLSSSNEISKKIFPEMCYYYGRLNFIDKLKKIIEENRYIYFSLPDSTKEFGNILFNIGIKFPNLNSEEIDYLNEKYNNSNTSDIIETLMFDFDSLPRSLSKSENNKIVPSEDNISDSLLLNIYNSFIENSYKLLSDKPIKAYDILKKEIVLRNFDDLNLEEFIVDEPIRSNDLYILLEKVYNKECADYFLKAISIEFELEFENLINRDFYLVDAENILNIANDYFKDQIDIRKMQIEVSKIWINRIYTEFDNLKT